MPKYLVSSQVTVSCQVVVEADSPEEAKEKALELPMQSFCHSCSSPKEDEWSSSGELDGEPSQICLVTEIEDD